VSYEDAGLGTGLLKKDAMDRIAPDFVGKPVIIEHQDGEPDELFQNGAAVGKITAVRWNGDSGWYECDFTAENSEAADLIEKQGWSVSCAFDSNDNGAGGEYHAMPYDFEIMNGRAVHLALVPNPRYEDSKIFTNSGAMLINSKRATIVKENALQVDDPVQVNVNGEWIKGTIESIVGDLYAIRHKVDGKYYTTSVRKKELKTVNSKENAFVVWKGTGSSKEAVLRTDSEKEAKEYAVKVGGYYAKANAKENAKRKYIRCPECERLAEIKGGVATCEHCKMKIMSWDPADEWTENAKENAIPESKIRILAEKIIDQVNPATLSEQVCINFAQSEGMDRIDGQRAWTLIHREMRTMDNAIPSENLKPRVRITTSARNSRTVKVHKENKMALGLFKFLQKTKKENAVEATVDLKNSYVTVQPTKENGLIEATKVNLDELLNAQAETDAEMQNAGEDTGTEPLEITNAEEEIDVDGKKKKIGDLMENWGKRNAAKKKNDDKSDSDKKAKEREDEELTVKKQNAAAEAATSGKENGKRSVKHFQNLAEKHAAGKTNDSGIPTFETRQEKVARGRALFGKKA